MLAEDVEAFVAFGFQNSAWVEVKVLFDKSAEVNDTKNPVISSSWKLADRMEVENMADARGTGD